ncbi:MAG TPA: sigma-70 family RNA polymerase sigma factor [Terriglobia bacterium]|jgi:RNA polymerase sigma factor (sigma-70 family)
MTPRSASAIALNLNETLRQGSDNDRQAKLDALFLEHYDFLFRAAKAVLRKKDDACDVIQDLYLKCAERELHPDAMKNPKAFLHRAAVNMALDWKRSRKRWKADRVEDLDLPDASTGLANDKVREKLEDLLGGFNLKPETVQILILHHNEGYSDAEIGDLLGETRSKIASILSRTHAKLRNGKEDLDAQAQGQQYRRDHGAVSAARFRGGSPVGA